MSYQEKRSIVNIITTLLVTGLYYTYVFQTNDISGMSTEELLRFWSKAMLIVIPVMIVSKIVVHIVFGVTNTVITKEKQAVFEDERDKLIALLSTRNAFVIFGLGFVLSLIMLATGSSINVMFIILIIAGILSELFDNLSQLYFHKNGV